MPPKAKPRPCETWGRHPKLWQRTDVLKTKTPGTRKSSRTQIQKQPQSGQGVNQENSSDRPSAYQGPPQPRVGGLGGKGQSHGERS